MSNDVAVRGPASALAIADGQTGWTEDQVVALRHLGAEEASPADLAVFFHQATRTGLDPFAKQIYLIGRNEKKWNPQTRQETWSVKFTIQTGIDGFRLIARRAVDRAHETLAYEDTLWRGKDGRWYDAWDGPSEELVAAKTVVLRNGNPFPAVAHFREYAQTKSNGQLNSMWSRMGANQIAKCSEAAALRKAFPQDLSGIYIDEEMQQADQRAEESLNGGSRGAAPAQRVSPPRVGQVVVDGAAGPSRPAPVAAPASAPAAAVLGKDAAGWLAAVAGIADAANGKQVWAEAAAAGQLDLDVEGPDGSSLSVRERIIARVEGLQQAKATTPPPAAAPAAPAAGDGSMEAPLEPDEVIDAPGAHRLTEPDAADLRRVTPQRRAVLSQLIEVLGAQEAMEAVCEQEFGFGPDEVGTSRLREWLTREQRANARPAPSAA